MKKILNKKISVLMLALVLFLSFAACSSTAQEDAPANTDGNSSTGTLTGKVVISGSTSVQLLLQDLADAFKTVEPGIEIEILGSGSTQGIKDAAEGTSDLGASSRELTAEEKSLALTEYIIGYDGIAIVAHPDNTAASLTREQLVGIFKGEIANWNKVGGPDKEILAVVREENSGARDDFEEKLGLKDNKMLSLSKADALQADGAGAVKANIGAKDNAIGYISLGYAGDSLKKLILDGIECTPASIKDKSYPLSGPLLLLSKGELKPEAKTFLEYIESDDGQQIVGEKYITAK